MVRPLQGPLTGSSGPREAPVVSGAEDYHLVKHPFGLALSALEYQHIVLSMSSDKKKSINEVKAEIDELSKQLEEGIRLETKAKSKLAIEDEKEYQALLQKMIGRRIRITLEDDSLYGEEAVILRPHGKSKKPLYWWFMLTKTGKEYNKARASFKLLPLKDEPDDTKSH